MLYTQIVCLALTAAFTASQVSAIAHGEVADHDGKEIRWQQLGKGMYTGVPADEWNDESKILPLLRLGLKFLPISSSLSDGVNSS